MTSIVLVLSIIALFAAVLAYESADDDQVRLAPSGLLGWLISGNWPAKVGAGLVIIGVGALLRYAFANIDVPAELKLASGAVAAAILGFSAMALRAQPKRRAIHLALAGAAFGTAYLTAYSAYGIFKYINQIDALALLALVALAAGVFAVTTNAMSVAILAMVGAYVAPKFALGAPDVWAVYGYYLAASTLCLVMSTLRGWRPLIHLSFLFTLAGALFFGWSGKFYQPEHYQAMQPLLLALVLVHLIMPILERKQIRSARVLRFDLVYFLLLPSVAALLTLKIAPNLQTDGAIGVAALASMWAVATIALYLLKLPGAGRHALVALLLGVGALYLSSRDLPWLILGLGISVAVMAVASRFRANAGVQQVACGAATLCGVLHIIYSNGQSLAPQPILSEPFAYRMIASALMVLGAWIGIRGQLAFARTLGVVGIGWAALSMLSELLRLNLDFLPQLVYGLLLAGAVLSLLFAKRTVEHPVFGGLLIFALVATGWWASGGASDAFVVACAILTPLVLLAMAWAGRDKIRAENSDFCPSMAIGLLPFALLPWAISAANLTIFKTDFLEATMVMTGVSAAGLFARFWLSESPRWNDRIQPLHVYLTAFALLYVTLFHIERGIWPMVFEILALVYLITYVTRRSREQASVGFGVGAMMAVSGALVVQAMLLRAFGPTGLVLDASDINKMNLPAVVSLMWAVFGAALAIWGTHSKSRSAWSAGGVLLVIAAIKLVFFDSGDLGELGNILAFIASGAVFFMVAWLAPMPSKAAVSDAPSPQTERFTDECANSQPTARVIESMARPRSQPVHASFPSDIAQVEAGSARTSLGMPNEAPARTQARVSRNRQEPEGINGLWFLLLGFAICVAMVSTAWHKHARHQRELAQYRQQLAALRPDKEQRTADQQQPVDALPRPEPTPQRPNPARLVEPPELQRSTPVAPQEDRPVKVMDACSRFVEQLPADYVLLAAGAYEGHASSDSTGSGRRLGSFDVNVNLPGQKVVVALGAYEPSYWRLRTTVGTELVGIIVSGYHAQTMSGLRGVPVLNISYETKSPCGYFYLTRETANDVATTLRKILGRAAQSYTLAMDGKVDLSAKAGLSASNSVSPSGNRIERLVDANGRIVYREIPDSK